MADKRSSQDPKPSKLENRIALTREAARKLEDAYGRLVDAAQSRKAVSVPDLFLYRALGQCDSAIEILRTGLDAVEDAIGAALHAAVNGRAVVGQAGVRDPDYPCELFDARGYRGDGTCGSDGHYMCNESSQLSPDAPRFTQSRDGRRDRLRLYWARRAA